MISPAHFNNQVKQMMILGLLLLLIFLTIKELYIFLPGLLGALTLYILSRGTYFQLVYHRKWSKGWTAGLFLLIYFLLFGVLIYYTFIQLEKRIHPFLNNPSTMLAQAKDAIFEVQGKKGISFFSEETLANLQQKLSAFIPSLLNDTAVFILNLVLMLFMLYYMLVHGKEIENFLERYLPLKQKNIDMLASETKRVVKASALVIPIISLIQGITAMFGYIIFGVKEYVIFGFLTGVFAYFPVMGTLMIWVPIVIYMYAAGDNWNATGLFLYSLIITGNVDYLARISLLKKMGDVHPVVTVIGAIAGLGLFGFIGLIFGPLLVCYIILLFRIYSNEFIDHPEKYPAD